jgi:hypothetical protein
LNRQVAKAAKKKSGLLSALTYLNSSLGVLCALAVNPAGYFVSTLITSWPAYIPQLVQTWCDSIGSWHCGQVEICGAVSASCDLRNPFFLLVVFFFGCIVFSFP